MEKVTAYKCEHCKKLYIREANCKKHEMKCRRNPEHQRACYSCKHLEKVKAVSVSYDPYFGEVESGVMVLFCKKMQKAVHPSFVEGYDSLRRSGVEILNEVMPKECEHLASDLDF